MKEFFYDHSETIERIHGEFYQLVCYYLMHENPKLGVKVMRQLFQDLSARKKSSDNVYEPSYILDLFPKTFLAKALINSEEWVEITNTAAQLTEIVHKLCNKDFEECLCDK